jgi:hypothetical protein
MLVLGTSLQVAAFSRNELDNSNSHNKFDANFLNLLQQFFIQILGLYVTLVPNLRLNDSITLRSWIALLSIISVLLGLLSLVLYTSLKYGAAWAQLIAFFGSVAQILVVMRQMERVAAASSDRSR